MELSDCGKKLHLGGGSPRGDMDVTILMVIKAPKGIMRLFDQHYITPDTQCDAIKAFMKEHQND